MHVAASDEDERFLVQAQRLKAVDNAVHYIVFSVWELFLGHVDAAELFEFDVHIQIFLEMNCSIHLKSQLTNRYLIYKNANIFYLLLIYGAENNY